jgi:hypothetical protein
VSRKSNFHSNMTRIIRTLHEDLCTFMIISRSILLRMRNILEKSCRDNHNTYFMFNNFFPTVVLFMTCYEKNCYSRTGHRCKYAILRPTRFTCCITNARHTLRIWNTFCFSTVTIVRPTHQIVTLYVHCPSCSTFLLFIVFWLVRL